MRILENAQIATKCVEVSKSLVNTQIGLHSYELQTTRKIGDAARFAATIRMSGHMSEGVLAAVGDSLKIDFRIISAEIIPMFKDYGWIDTINEGSHIKRIDEDIPPIDDVLSTLGKRWNDEEPAEIERGTIYSLAQTSTRPTDKAALMSEIEVNEDVFQPILEYGTQAKYLGTFSSEESGNDIIWSPLYWNNKSDALLKYLRKQDDSQLEMLSNLAMEITALPGIPKENISQGNYNLLDSGIHFGFYSQVEILRDNKNYRYIFPPSSYFSLEPKKDIFEKARMIVACIRHGQYHAEVSRILYPVSILRAMVTNTMKPHPYALVQYALLKLHGIIDLIPAETKYGSAYKVIWINSPENNLAAEMAEQLLKGEEIYPHTSQEVEAKKVLFGGEYNYSSEQRRLIPASCITGGNHYKRLMEHVMGVRL